MRLGVMIGASGGPGSSLDDVIDQAKRVETAGFSRLGLANIFSFEAISTLALVGRETKRIELGTAVVPTYPRHPSVMAQLALTAAAASGNRFALGIGLSHRVVIEDMLGYSYERPARHMKEYLEILAPLLRGEGVDHDGDLYKAHLQLEVPGAEPVPLLVAALGPMMLKLCGQHADGTITWMCGPKTLGEHIGPTLRSAAREAGRPEPRVVSMMPIVLTTEVDAARAAISEQLAVYGQLPSYRAMLDREGVEGPADNALVGDEASLRSGIDRLRDAGVTDLDFAIVPTDEGAHERTFQFVKSLND